MSMIPNTRQKAEEILSQYDEATKDALYRSIWFDHVRKDIRDHEDEMDLDKPLTDEQVDYAAERYVYNGDYDCNQSYWENIEGVIKIALEEVRVLKLIVSSIDWDYPGKECPPELPDQVIIENPPAYLLEDLDDDAANLVEYLTEEFECCVCGFVPEVEGGTEHD